MIDMCRTSVSFTDHHGAYLITPDFPFSYAPGRHCSCTLETVAADGQLALEFIHVRLRQHHHPALCTDWVDVEVTALLYYYLFIIQNRTRSTTQRN